MNKRRIHDGIVGVVVLATATLGAFSSALWLFIPAALGVILIQSAFTGFCPVYYILDKIQADDK